MLSFTVFAVGKRQPCIIPRPVPLDGVVLPAVTAAFPPGKSLYDVLQRASNHGAEEKVIAPSGKAKRKKVEREMLQASFRFRQVSARFSNNFSNKHPKSTQSSPVCNKMR